jgi:hypothetical protein
MMKENNSESITASSSRDWLDRNQLAVKRYLRENHKHPDFKRVMNLIYWVFPDEGMKLIKNYSSSEKVKKDLLLDWIIFTSQLTCIILGDQRMGKDSLVCKIFEDCIKYLLDNDIPIMPRIVTLGNMKCPPFVDEKDMYFSFKDIPFGTKNAPVWIYCSELEAEFPSRDFASAENKLFSVLEGTLAQNSQKLFGCVKLTSKVDISVLRSCNLKLFKFISPEKLEMEGIERVNVLSDLGRWFLPKDRSDKSRCLMVFDNNLLTASYVLPSFWSEEYSEQFKGDTIPLSRIYDFVKARMSDKVPMPPSEILQLQTMVNQKFRRKLTSDEIKSCQ